ncbi:hypothetical protein GCM10011579_028530 [Streptomyces albiflavescens]|uniref:Transposase n=1 Tax=Streptomyces albiflavescens TaxID=1623582 RepID=A0A918D3L6_9ACTN|nr:hypothetical protein GCM10011579_028530 [Streptomyces albiflavescens]
MTSLSAISRFNSVIRGAHSVAERANALLKVTFKALRRVSLDPKAITRITRAVGHATASSGRPRLIEPLRDGTTRRGERASPGRQGRRDYRSSGRSRNAGWPVRGRTMRKWRSVVSRASVR